MPYKDQNKNREYLRKWRKAHREYTRAHSRTWRKEHRERIRVYDRKWRKAHPGYYSKYQRSYWRKWYRTARGRAIIVAQNAKRRAQQLGVLGPHFTDAQFLRLCKMFGNRCLCCGGKRKLGADHVVPFSRNGSNRIGNIQPLCEPCNRRKGSKVIDYRKGNTCASDL